MRSRGCLSLQDFSRPAVLFLVAAIIPLSTERCVADEPSSTSAKSFLQRLAEGPLVNARLRIPEAVVADLVSSDFNYKTPVARTILGTHSTGTAECLGAVTVKLIENKEGAEFECRVTGTVTSTTCGINGPAIIKSRAITHFTASKLLFFDGTKFQARPTHMQAQTALIVDNITSTKPGLRGRIVTKVAQKKAKQSHHEAQAIAADLTRKELCEKIEKEFSERLETLNSRMEKRLAALKYFASVGREISIRSFDSHLEIAFGRSEKEATPLPARSEQLASDKTVELWLNFPNRELPSMTLANFLTKVPDWLSTYLKETPEVAKLTESDFEIARRSNWLVLQLNN